MARRKQYPLRVDPVIWEAIERWAADEMRSANGQVEFLLRDALRRAGRLPQNDGTTTKSPSDGGGRLQELRIVKYVPSTACHKTVC